MMRAGGRGEEQRRHICAGLRHPPHTPRNIPDSRPTPGQFAPARYGVLRPVFRPKTKRQTKRKSMDLHANVSDSPYS